MLFFKGIILFPVMSIKAFLKDNLPRPVVAKIRIARGYTKALKAHIQYYPRRILSAQDGNDLYYEKIKKGIPFAAGKSGSTELLALRYYEYKWKPSNGARDDWFDVADELNELSGVFPTDKDIFLQFCDYFQKNLQHIDDLGVWFHDKEQEIFDKYASQATLMRIRSQEPYCNQRPWSAALSGKTVLAVHPFEATILHQKDRLQEIWQKYPDVMPKNVTIKTLKVPQYAKLVPPIHDDWFDGLKDLSERMAKIDFDVAIIGAGAWSLPLAVHAKKLGKIGIHMGGSSQLLFGIKGDRWSVMPDINQFWNDSWINPLPEDTPKKADIVEGGCYW